MALVVVSALGASVFIALRHPRASSIAAFSTISPPSVPPAEDALRSTLARLPRDPDAQRALARYLLDQHRPAEALWHFQAALDLRPSASDSQVDAARALAQTGFPDRAQALLRTRLRQASSDLDARRALAEAALAIARPDEALAALAGAGPALSTSAPALLLLGDAHAAAGDMAGARPAYRRAVALEPESAAGHDRLGRLALARGDWAEAKRELGAAREREPGNPGHGYRLGEAYWRTGERAEAEQLWQEVVDSSPGYAPVQVAVGKVFQLRKDWDTAAAHLAVAVGADPASQEAQSILAEVMAAKGDGASAHYQRGFYDLETDRPHLALEEFRRMMAVDPKRVDGPLMTSFAYAQMNDVNQAAAEAQKGLIRHPHDSRLLARPGLMHVLGRNRPAAKRLCEEWLKFEPQAAEPYRLLGRIAREELRMRESLYFYERALERNAGDPVICSEMAKTLSGIPGPENRRRAMELTQRATTLNPREADYWQQLGDLLRAAGRASEAADAFLHALDMNPMSVASCTALVQIAAQAQRPGPTRFYADLARELQDRTHLSQSLWQEVYQRPTDPLAHKRLARFLLGAGDLRRAGYQLQQAVALRPSDHVACRQLAFIEQFLDLRKD